MTRTLTVLPFMLLLFILPFPGTVALRLVCLSVAFLVATLCWRRLAPPPIPCMPALAAWAAIALLSLAGAIDPAYSLGEIKNEILYTMMAFVAFYAVARSDTDLRLLLVALAAGAVLICSLALESELRLGTWNDEGLYGGRASFAGYALALAPALLLLGARSPGRWARAALAVLFLIIAAVAYLTLQRVVWWALALQASLALVLSWRGGLLKMRPLALAACVAGAIVLCGALFHAAQQQKFEYGTSDAEAVAEDTRLGQWGPVVGRIAEHPIKGAGFGRRVMSKAYPDLIPESNPLFWHAHNIFLNYGLEMGIPGMLALAWVFVSLVREYWRLCAAGGREAILIGVAGIMLVCGILLRNQVNDMLVRDGAILFWALNGALLGCGRRKLLARDG